MTRRAAGWTRAVAARGRRFALRTVRRRILALDRDSDFPGFLLEASRILVSGTRAGAVGVVARFPEMAEDFLVLVVPGEGPLQRVVPLEPGTDLGTLAARGESRTGSAFFRVELGDAARARGVVPSTVFAAGMSPPGRRVMEVELADPDPRIVPDAGTLADLLSEVAAAFELAYLYDRLGRERLESRMLLHVGRELGRTLDLKALLDSILDRLRLVVPYEAAAIYLLGEESLEVVHQSHRGYASESDEFVRLKVGQGLVGWVARTGEALTVPDVRRDPRYVSAREETASELVVPLLSGGRVFGVFNLESDRRNAYTSHHVQLVTTVATQAAAALERSRLLEEEKAKRRLEQEVQIARRIQRSFLPRPGPALWERGIGARMVPSREVSGDYYDLVERKDGLLAVAVADVSGKGVPAALIMASLRSAFRLAAGTDDPAHLCRDLNTFLRSSLRETEFVTGVFGFLDLEARRFRYCNAGHNAPLIFRGWGEVESLETGGPLLGVMRDAEYRSDEIILRDSDLLVLYTDGITEAFRPDRGEFGVEGILRVLRGSPEAPPQEVANAVVHAVRAFMGGPAEDDMTLVVVRGRA